VHSFISHQVLGVAGRIRAQPQRPSREHDPRLYSIYLGAGRTTSLEERHLGTVETDGDPHAVRLRIRINKHRSLPTRRACRNSNRQVEYIAAPKKPNIWRNAFRQGFGAVRSGPAAQPQTQAPHCRPTQYDIAHLNERRHDQREDMAQRFRMRIRQGFICSCTHRDRACILYYRGRR
jgi:hypothetical protein